MDENNDLSNKNNADYKHPDYLNDGSLSSRNSLTLLAMPPSAHRLPLQADTNPFDDLFSSQTELLKYTDGNLGGL